VIIRLDDALAMAVLPASYQIDLESLRKGAGAQNIALVGEAAFRSRFPGCETGAMPVFVDERLTRDKEISFSAGTHNETMRLSYEDFYWLAKPKVLNFAISRAEAHAA
jgi:Ala-tRNA(Pro) deacylase